MEEEMHENVTVDGQEISYQEFQEVCQNLKNSQRLVETADSTYVTVVRMNS